MKKIKKFKIKDYFNKKTGKLLPITFDKKFPIKAKRVFFLYGKKNYKNLPIVAKRSLNLTK